MTSTFDGSVDSVMTELDPTNLVPAEGRESIVYGMGGATEVIRPSRTNDRGEGRGRDIRITSATASVRCVHSL